MTCPSGRENRHECTYERRQSAAHQVCGRLPQGHLPPVEPGRIRDHQRHRRHVRSGDPIPTAAGEIEETELMPLADAPVGAKLELRQVGTQDAARLRYLADQGLTPGVLLVVSDRQPFNGPTTIALVPSGDPRIVGRDLAQLLWCREVPVEDRGRPAT